MICFQQLTMFFKLLYTRLYAVRLLISGKTLNISIWSFCNLLVFGYVMQQFGLGEQFGLFQLGGVIAAAGLFESYGNIASIIMDFAGEKSIEYYLTLPAAPSVVLMSIACSYALVGFFLSLVMVLLGKLIFFNTLFLGSICWYQLLGILLIANFFYGCLAMAIAAYVGQVSKIGNVWSRFIFPLWFLGGYQFSWKAMHTAFPRFSYLLFLNPITHIMEATRVALLGQEGYIDWTTSFSIVCISALITWFFAYNRMKKILDFV